MPKRRRPTQLRAQLTVESILDAVVRLLRREGIDSVTTNRIAEVAGVSIGSLYQYFPNKRAILVALHQRHIEQIDRLIQATLIRHAASSLDELIRAIIEAMIETHTSDPELYSALAAEVPHRAGGSKDFAVRLHGVFRLAIAACAPSQTKDRDLDRTAFVVAHMVESLAHGAVLRRPPGLSIEAARAEAVKAVLAYLHA